MQETAHVTEFSNPLKKQGRWLSLKYGFYHPVEI